MMALLCGIRRGELLALRWEDVDFEGGWVSLRNAIVRVRLKRLKEQPASRFSGMGSRLAPLKTPQSRRTLELPPTLITILKKHRTQQDAQRKAAGAKWSEGDFVFTSEFGAHWHPCTATSIYADVRLQADLPIQTSLHDLRHSLASAMLKRGMSAKHVQAQLGHSKIQMTLDAYSHLMPGERTGISDVMSDFIAEGKRDTRSETRRLCAVTSALETTQERHTSDAPRSLRSLNRPVCNFRAIPFPARLTSPSTQNKSKYLYCYELWKVRRVSRKTSRVCRSLLCTPCRLVSLLPVSVAPVSTKSRLVRRISNVNAWNSYIRNIPRERLDEKSKN